MLNSCSFIGNCGADPEIKTLPNSDKRVANLSLGVTEKWKNKQTGAREERTEWIRLNCFQDGLVGVIQSYVKKGSKIYVSGKLATRKWQTQSGEDRYSTEINIDKLILLDSPSNNANSGGNYGAASQGGQQGNFDDDSIPFSMEWRG